MTARRPRVLLHAFSTFRVGGPQARFVTLANAFGCRYHHLVMSMDGNYEAADRLDSSVSWEPIRLPNQRGDGLANRGFYRTELKRLRPDLVLTYNWGAIEWLAANTPEIAPHIHVEDGFGPEEANGQLARRQWFRRALLGVGRRRLLVPSLQLKRMAASWWVGDSRVLYVPNGVSVSPEAKPRVQIRTNNGFLTIGTVAALRPEKNLARLLKAVAALREQHMVRLMIVGDGPSRGELEQLAVRLGLSECVTFTGYTSTPQLELARMDLFALSSDTEQLPIALLEAMADGLPVMATAVGDVPFIIPPSAAKAICQPDDMVFLETLRTVLKSRTEWGRWAQDGLVTVREHYTQEAMFRRWQEVFEGGPMPASEVRCRQEIGAR